MSPLVLVFFIVCPTLVLLGMLIILGNVAVIRAKADQPLFNKKKQSLVPRVHHPEPGVCQCGDALSYHSLAKNCSVPGCPCQFFVPSDLDPQRLEEVSGGMISRLALETVNLRSEMATKQAALTAREKSLRVRESGGYQ